MGRPPLFRHAMMPAERKARQIEREVERRVQARLATASKPPPAPGADAALQATARELKRQQQRTGELEAENEKLRVEVAKAAKPVDGCAFCLKTEKEVTTLIKGQRMMICNECVAQCAGHIANRKAERAG